MTYATTTALKTYMSVTTTDDDALLADLLDRATAIIDTHTQRTFAVSADTTRYFDALRDVDGHTLYINRDLCAITSVTNGDGTTVAASAYVTEPRNERPWYALRLKTNGAISWTYTTDPEDAIVIVGRWGYSTTPPDDIVQACVRLAAWLYRQKDTSIDQDAPRASMDGSMLMPSRLPYDLVQLLERYVRRVI